MNTIVFNELSGQVLFEDKANEVEMSSRNYLDVIDGQHPDLLSSKQTIRESQAMRHRRSGYVQAFTLQIDWLSFGVSLSRVSVGKIKKKKCTSASLNSTTQPFLRVQMRPNLCAQIYAFTHKKPDRKV